MTLNMSMRLVVFVWLTLQTCEGSIRCFECTDTFKPYFCDMVTLCADSEECFVDQFVTSGGEVLFNSGCRSKQRCDVHRKRGVVGVSSDVINDALPEDSSTDILTCQNCCNDTNYCNNKGCNEAPPERSQRGPLCFECTNQNSHGCRHVTRCDLNFACEIVKKEVDNFTLYDSGCVHVTPTTVCNITYGAQYSQQVALVGKREATHDNCPKCCDWDFCNDACTGQEAVGGFTNWESWSPCPNTCGGAGNQFRMRTCTVQRCVGALYEHRSCGYQTPCPIDGGFSTWGFWSGCTTTCGGHGTQSRHRSCTNPAPAFGGNTCKGFFDEVIPCGNTTCPSATSIYDTWTQWSACSVSCGPAGHQRRQKLCFTANHVLNESLCKQPLWETRACNQNVTCPAVDGVWKEWSVWGACSVTCGSGIKERTRVCEPPRNGGHYCIGDNTERDVCHRDHCPVTDVYTDWGPWGPCTVSCGKHGNQIRTRTCQSTSCDGDTSSLTETKLCQHLHHCVVDGGWGAWQSWGRCSVTCGDGHRFRSRTCNHPTPRNGGDPCHGNSRQRSPCHIDCPVPVHELPYQPSYIQLYNGTEVCEQAGYEMQPWNLNGYRTVVMCDRIYTTPDTWSSARQTCKQNGADLITFSSSDSSLNHRFPRLMDATNWFWIGLEYAGGRWIWVDGGNQQLGTFAEYQLGQYYVNHIHLLANTFSHGRACVVDNGKEWEPVDCSEDHMFVCEKHLA